MFLNKYHQHQDLLNYVLVLFILLIDSVNVAQFFNITCLSFLTVCIAPGLSPVQNSYGSFNKYVCIAVIT